MTDTPPDVPVVNPLAVPTRPVQDGIIDPAWGQWIHDSNARPTLHVAHADLVFSTPSQIATMPIPEAVGPCLVMLQASYRFNGGGAQFMVCQLKIGAVAKATATISAPTAPAQTVYPGVIFAAVPEAAAALSAVFSMGSAPVAMTVTEISYVVVPLPTLSGVTIPATAASRPGETVAT
jgi:hypothetical protein